MRRAASMSQISYIYTKPSSDQPKKKEDVIRRIR